MKRSIAVGLSAMILGAGLAAAPAGAAVITQEYFELWYDHGEFFANADGKEFRVEIHGNPFAIPSGAAAQEKFETVLLAVMQAHKPRPRLTFVTKLSGQPTRPDYRFALLFNPTDAGPVNRTCSGLDQAEMTSPRSGEVVLEIAYCRNDQTMSSLKARFAADSASDPRLGTAFDQIFSALVPQYNPIRGERPGHRKN